jgi:hypothetical protein
MSALKGYAVLQRIFFAPTEASQDTGADFIQRLGAAQGNNIASALANDHNSRPTRRSAAIGF